jgi:hypothetical protein
MVIVVLGDEDLAYSAKRYPRHRKLPGDAVSGIDDVRLVVDDQYVGRL